MRVPESAAIALMMMVGAAEAACSTANLAGKWVIVGRDQVCQVTIKPSGRFSGSCTDNGQPLGTMTLTSDCKVTGVGDFTTFTGRTEAIDPGSALKPNLIVAASADNTVAFSAYRQ